MAQFWENTRVILLQQCFIASQSIGPNVYILHFFFVANDQVGADQEEIIDVDYDDDDVFGEDAPPSAPTPVLSTKPRTQSLSALPKKKDEGKSGGKKVSIGHSDLIIGDTGGLFQFGR